MLLDQLAPISVSGRQGTHRGDVCDVPHRHVVRGSGASFRLNSIQRLRCGSACTAYPTTTRLPSATSADLPRAKDQ